MDHKLTPQVIDAAARLFRGLGRVWTLSCVRGAPYIPSRAVVQSTLEWHNTLFRAVLALPKGALAMFVLPSALVPNTG